MVAKEGAEGDTKHGGDEEQEQNVKFPSSLTCCSKSYTSITGRGPELDEVLKRGERDKCAVEKTIEEKQNKKLVIIKGHTVVDPGAVVIHFKNAAPTH